MSRSKRRHHRNRIKNKVLSYRIVCNATDKRYIGKAVKTRSWCRCLYCVNPRKHGHETLKEESSRESFSKIELKDIADE